MGKQKVSSMFASTSMFRKNKEDQSRKIKEANSIMEDVLAEITPDVADREKRRRQTGRENLSCPDITANVWLSYGNLLCAIEHLGCAKSLNCRLLTRC